MTRNCEACGHTFDERMLYQLMTGWVPTSKRAATPKAKRWEQRWACKPCVDAMARAGHSWQQLSLL